MTTEEFDSLYHQATILWKSSLKKKFETPEDLLRVMLAASEMGASPYAAGDKIYITKEGNLGLKGVVAKSILLSNKQTRNIDESATDTGHTVTVTYIDTYGNEREVSATYTVEDAKRAQLWVTPELASIDSRAANSYWHKYPKDMLMWKAWYKLINTYFPHIVVFPIIEAVDNDSVVAQPKQDVAKEVVATPKTAKVSVDVIRETMEQLESAQQKKAERIKAEKEATKEPEPKESDDMFFIHLDVNELSAFATDDLKIFAEKLDPSYGEKIGGKRLTAKKLVDFIIEARIAYLESEEVFTPEAEPEDDEPITIVAGATVEDKGFVGNTEDEVEQYIHGVKVENDNNFTIPEFDTPSGRSVMVAQSILSKMESAGINPDDIDEWLEQNTYKGFQDVQDLAMEGSEEDIHYVIAQLGN
jgi:hypothetical protein